MSTMSGSIVSQGIPLTRLRLADGFLLVLPIHGDDSTRGSVPAREVTKIALRLKFFIEQIIPYEIDENIVTKSNSPVLTRDVEKTAQEAAAEEHRACIVFCLLVCKTWFLKQS